MKSFNAMDEKNDIEDGLANPVFLELSETTAQGFLADSSQKNGENESVDPDYQNQSAFLASNPMKNEAKTVKDRRPSSAGPVEVSHHHPITFKERFLQFFGLAPSPLDIARREKYLEMLEEMRATGPLKGNRAIDTAVANPKFLKMLEKYDTNGDGVIDAEEMTVMLNDFNSQKHQSSLLKKVVAGAFLFLIALLVCNTFLTLWVIKLTQEVYVDDDTTSMVNSHNEILKTDKPKFYTSISDLTMLPASALDSITRMTFTTIDGGVYNLLVNGVRMDATAEKSVDIYFTSNKRMHLKGNNTAVFVDYDVDGTSTEVAVVLNVNDPLSTLSQSRRLSASSTPSSMVSSLGFTGAGSVISSTVGSDRCFSSGVCLYTYDEMISLFDEHAAAENRRLQSASSSSTPSSSTMTYTEITADAKILTKDDRAGLSRAQGFLEALLQAQADLKNGTLKVSFIMSDLCANYPTLRNDCRLYPAPSVVRPVNVSSLQDRRPFIGTMAEDGLWMFQDEIEYLLDAYSVQVKVRYAHDPLRDTRRHVVLMDLSNPSKMVTYDEVTIQYDPKNPTFLIQSAQTFITNYNASSAVKSDGTDTFLDGGVDVETGSRRRLMAHDAFVAHVRSKISGFPSIDIPPEMLTSSVFHELEKDSMLPMYEVNRRLNAVGSSRNISVEVEESADGYCVSTEMDEDGNYLPCLSDVTTLSMQYPKSYFSNVWIGTLSGSIAWPNASSIYSIEKYETTEIVYRSDLKALVDAQIFSNDSSNGTSSRRFLSDFSSSLSSGYELTMPFLDNHQRMRIARHAEKHEQLRERTKAQFEALDAAFGKMLEKHERRRRLIEIGVNESHVQRKLSTDAVNTFKTKAVTTHTTVNQFGGLRISDDSKDKMKNKIPNGLYNSLISSFVSVSSGLSQVPMRRGSTCAQFHGLFDQFLQNVADLNDVVVKAMEYSDNVDRSIDSVKDLQDMLKDLIMVNNVMKPVMPAVGSIPYVGPVAKVFQNTFNTVVTNPITPAKKSVDSLQTKITQSRIKEYNAKFFNTAQNISTIMFNFVSDSTIYSDVLIAADNVCLWTPTTVNGVVTYNYTLTGQTCSTLNTVLKEVLSDINSIKSKVDIFLGRIQQVSNFVDIARTFIRTFDAQMISLVQSIFAVIASFMNKQISACIPWVCFRNRQICSTISYPCGVKKCRTPFGRIPCGVKWCSGTECVTVPEPYECPQCASFTVQQIINGVMSVMNQLQSIIINALNSLAKALGITFPEVSIPGLPSIDFMSGVESFLTSLFDDIMSPLNSVAKDLNKIRSKFQLSSLVCNK